MRVWMGFRAGVLGGVGLCFVVTCTCSWLVLRFLFFRVGKSSNEGFGKELHRKGNSLKRLRAFSKSPHSEI